MKPIRAIIVLSAILFISSFSNKLFAQNDSHAAAHPTVVKGSSTILIDKAMTDTGLVNKKFRILEYVMAPGQFDTVAHRHGAEVFIYVAEGSIEHLLGNEKPTVYTQGQVLHEPPYSLHVYTRNTSTTTAAKLLITYVYTDGPKAPIFIREYPLKK